MKNLNKKTNERVEVMALFGYEMTPCQPLSFKRRGEAETPVTDLIQTRVRFAGDTTRHIFDILAGQVAYRLEFNSADLSWHLMPA